MKYQTWTQQELDFLIQNYSTKGAKGCILFLQRPLNSIRAAAGRLHLKHPRPAFNKKEYIKKYRLLHKEECARKDHLRYLQNITKIKAQTRAYAKHQAQTNPYFRLSKNMRARIRDLLRTKNASKTRSTFELIGCNINELKLHLQSKFTDGMSWANYGKWHVDHIKPCSSFDLTQPDQQKLCFHFSNLQPLWAIDNLRKSNKV